MTSRVTRNYQCWAIWAYANVDETLNWPGKRTACRIRGNGTPRGRSGNNDAAPVERHPREVAGKACTGMARVDSRSWPTQRALPP